MVIIHISEADASRDFAGLMAKVRAGAEVHIGDGLNPGAVIRASLEETPKKTLSSAIRLAEEQNLTLTLDDRWSDDLEAVIRNHEHEGLRNPWEE